MNSYRYDSYSKQGSPTIGPGMISPFIKWMLIANVAVFLIQNLPRFIPSFVDITPIFGLTPALFLHQFPTFFFQLFTYMFLHAGLGHIFFNLLALWMFGTEIELTWGTRSFARFYVICGLAGAVLTLLVFPNQSIPMIGASGAIWGILVAYWLMFPDRYLYLYFLLPIKVRWAIPGLLILSIFTAGANVAHMAHIGGAVCGLAYLKVDWRWNWLSRRVKDLRYRRQEAKLDRRREEAAEIMKRVDAILDKITAVGIENLTKAERKFLDEASSHLKQQRDKADK
jgi:membrane associated rhomboid family serine protease